MSLTSEEIPKKDIKNKRKRVKFFEGYITKVLKSVSPRNGLTTNAKQQLNSAICIIAREISKLVVKLTEMGKKRTLSDKEIEKIVVMIFPEEFATNAVSEGRKALQTFQVVINQEKTTDVKGGSRQGKAGIIFPPSIAEKFLRNFGYSKAMVTKSSSVFFAGVLEYITLQILQDALKITEENKRVRITLRELQLAVGKNRELSSIFSKFNISFLGGGVVPFIHPLLIARKNKTKNTTTLASKDGEKKPHRFRPGTVAIREIKKYQKMSDCLMFAKFPFERVVRGIVGKYQDGMKISKDVFIIIQHYIEQYIVDFLRQANAASLHAGRVKLMSADIDFISFVRYGDKIVDSIEDVDGEDIDGVDVDVDDDIDGVDGDIDGEDIDDVEGDVEEEEHTDSEEGSDDEEN
jgi:histone H3